MGLGAGPRGELSYEDERRRFARQRQHELDELETSKTRRMFKKNNKIFIFTYWFSWSCCCLCSCWWIFISIT